MDQIFKNNGYKVLELFINNPFQDYSIRGIARELKVSHATVLNYIKTMFKLGLVKKNNRTLYPTYNANTENENFLFYKRNAEPSSFNTCFRIISSYLNFIMFCCIENE